VWVWLSRALLVLAAAAFVGFRTQAVLLGACGIFAYLFLLNKHVYQNHLYSLILFLLLASLMPSGERWTVDAWLRRRRGAPPRAEAEAWAARLAQVTVSFIYLCSALSKTSPEFISGHLMRAFVEGGFIRPLPLLDPSGVPYPVQAAVALVVEYFLGIALWIRRLRPAAVAIGLLFHLYMHLTMAISSFSLQMFAAYLLFCDPYQNGARARSR
jgi:hypothetical protein